MPIVNGRHFAYTKSGYAAADKERKKARNRRKFTTQSVQERNKKYMVV